MTIVTSSKTRTTALEFPSARSATCGFYRLAAPVLARAVKRALAGATLRNVLER
jgi:hypothetical protein